MFIISLAFDFIYHQPGHSYDFQVAARCKHAAINNYIWTAVKKKKISLKIVSHSVWQTANSSACLALTFWCRCLESQKKKKKKKNVRHFCRTTHNRPPWSCWKLDVCTFVLPRSQRRSAAFRTRPQSYVLHSLYNISVRRWSLFFLSVFFFICVFVCCRFCTVGI